MVGDRVRTRRERLEEPAPARRPEPAPAADRVLALQRQAGNAAVARMLAGRTVARMKISAKDSGGPDLDTDAPDFAAQVKGIKDLAVLRNIARYIAAAPAPTVNDQAAAQVVAEQRKLLGGVPISTVEADAETAMRQLIDKVIAGTETPENALTQVKSAREAMEKTLGANMKTAELRGVTIDTKKWLSQLMTEFASKLQSYIPMTSRPPARDYFRGSKVLSVGKPSHIGTDSERAAVRLRHQVLMTALAGPAHLDPEDIEYIIDSLLNPEHAGDAARFADEIATTIPCWARIKLPGLQEDLRKLKGDRAAWKGCAAELVYVKWEIDAGHVSGQVSLGSRKEMDAQTNKEVPQDIDVSFVDATDMVRHYHEVKADPSALLSKAKTVDATAGKQVVAYGRVKTKRETDKGSPRKIRFVCVGTRGWTSLYSQGAMTNIANAGMELQLGKDRIYDSGALTALASRLAEFRAGGLVSNEDLDRWEYAWRRWPTPAEFEADYVEWKASRPLKVRKYASASQLRPGQRAWYVESPSPRIEVEVVKIGDLPKDAAPPHDAGDDRDVAKQGDAQVYVRRKDGSGGIRLLPVAALDG